MWITSAHPPHIRMNDMIVGTTAMSRNAGSRHSPIGSSNRTDNRDARCSIRARSLPSICSMAA